jgi:hypothetical protein
VVITLNGQFLSCATIALSELYNTSSAVNRLTTPDSICKVNRLTTPDSICKVIRNIHIFFLPKVGTG